MKHPSRANPGPELRRKEGGEGGRWRGRRRERRRKRWRRRERGGRGCLFLLLAVTLAASSSSSHHGFNAHLPPYPMRLYPLHVCLPVTVPFPSSMLLSSQPSFSISLHLRLIRRTRPTLLRLLTSNHQTIKASNYSSLGNSCWRLYIVALAIIGP